MENFLHTLLNMSLAASVAALVVMALRLLLGKAPKALVCALWLVVLFRMLCPVSFSLPVSLMPQPVASGTVTERILPAPASTPPTPAPATAPKAAAPAVGIPHRPVNTAPGLREEMNLSSLLFALWVTGAAGTLLWSVISYVRLLGRVRDGVRIRDNIYESDRVDSPFVCGFLRPRIYLPAGLEGPDRRYVLLHEQAHIDRGDHLWKPLAWLALCLHWFNPLLWLAFRLYGRDVESACDQRVIRDFGAEDVSGYAAALLHLGQGPLAAPLAFGEEHPMGRIRHILGYRRPALFVIIPAILIGAGVAILLLANPGTHRGPQLEGVSLTRVFALDEGTVPVSLPEELVQELGDLLQHYDQEDYEALDNFSPSPGDIRLSSTNRGTMFYLTDTPTGTLSLVRENHDSDGYCSSRKIVLLPELAEDPDYAPWRKALTDYLNIGRADELFALRTPYIGDASACGAILEALDIYEAVGPYTMELDTADEPYGITLKLERIPESPAEQLWRDNFLQVAGQLFLALVDNAGLFEWEDPASRRGTYPFVEASSFQIPAASLSEEEQFRTIYTQCRTLWKEGAVVPADFQADPSATWKLAEALYVSPDYPFARDAFSYTGTLTMDDTLFSVQPYSMLSSAWPPAAETVPQPQYLETQVTDMKILVPPYEGGQKPIRVPDGLYGTRDLEEGEVLLDLSGEDWLSTEVYTRDGEDTGFRLYQKGEELWLARWLFPLDSWEDSTDQNGELRLLEDEADGQDLAALRESTLDFLFRLEPEDSVSNGAEEE